MLNRAAAPTRPPTILVVEDDERIAEPLLFSLMAEGYDTAHAPDGAQGLELARSKQPDLVLLDVMLPDMDGFSVCRSIRAESGVPIIMMTARSMERDRVLGLDAGADDYVVKPFSYRELLARVRAALRRREIDRGEGTGATDQIVIDDIRLDHTARLVWRGGRPVSLTTREFNLLRALMQRAGEAVHRQVLLDLAWGEGWIGDPRTLDVHVRWLREKLEDDPSAPRYLQTVRGFGYRFASPSLHAPESA
jgi:DNA-binding response OmpR family regulator